MKFLVIALVSLDFLIMVPVVYKSIKRFPFKKLFNLGKDNDAIEKYLDKNKSSLNIVVRIILILIFIFIIMIIISIITMSIWVSIILYIKYSIKIALLGFLIIVFLKTLLADILIANISKKNKGQNVGLNKMIINDWLIVISLMLFTMLIIFDFKLNLAQNTLVIIKSDFKLALFWGSLFPILFLSAIITNIFMIILKMLHNFSKEIKFRLIDLLIIITTSTFFGIIFINNLDVAHLPENEIMKLYRNVDSIQIIMTAFLVPLIIKKLFNKNKLISNVEVSDD